MIRGGRSYGTNDLVSDGVDQVSNVKEASSYVAKSSLSTQHVVEKSINMAASKGHIKKWRTTHSVTLHSFIHTTFCLCFYDYVVV